MDLLETLGISPPAAENAVCFEIYDQSFVHGTSEAQLEALRVMCMQLVLPYLEGYIWQHDTFTLQSSLKQLPPWVLKKRGKARQQQQQQQQELPCLWGVVRYDDNVEDEWFVVWVLLELSRRLPGLCVRVWDDDGDFLLIEAAFCLPRWLKPETATHRVWLRGGQLHIIPPPSARTPTLPAQPTLREALNILSSGNINTHRPKVECAVLSRLSGYPDKARQQQQRVLTWLPRRVGRLLQEDPQLIAAAAAAFMTRTREEVQSAAKHSHLPPVDMITALVTMSKCQYAQLMQADFTTPRSYPAPDHDWLGGEAARQDKARGMGAKIHTGMEIMCRRMGLTSSSSSSSSSSSTEQGVSADTTDAAAASSQQEQQQQQLSSNPAWHHHLTVLRQSGYFTGELEGSARYKQLMAAAQTAFKDSAAYLGSSEAMAAPMNHLQQLLSRIDQQPLQVEQDCSAATSAAATRAGAMLSPAAAVLGADGLCEDSDSWMEDEAAAVQHQLEAAEAEVAAHAARKEQRKAAATVAAGSNMPVGKGGSSISSSEAVMVDAEQLVAGFKVFVQHAAAGPEGAEVPTQASAAAAAAQRPAASVEFNPDSFLTELMGVFGTTDPGNSSSSSRAGQQHQDPDAVLSQLQSLQQQLIRVLEDQPGGAGGRGGQAGVSCSSAPPAEIDSSDEGWDTTSTEGSSFYDSDVSDEAPTEQEAGHSEPGQPVDEQLNTQAGAGVQPHQLAVPPPVSGLHMQQKKQQAGVSKQQQQQQQQQQQWQLPPSFRGSALQEAWEVTTATDSDDEDNLSLGGGDDVDSDSETADDVGKRNRHDGNKHAAAGFYDAYSTALEAELAGTTLAQSFERAPAQAATAAAGSSDVGTANPIDEGLAPVDVDLNLIKSLVASYTAQGGLPGPASNLAGLLGLQLPTEIIEEQ